MVTAGQECNGGAPTCGIASAVPSGSRELRELLPIEYTQPASLMGFHAALVSKSCVGEFLKLLQVVAPFSSNFLHLKRVRPAPHCTRSGFLQVLVCPSTVELPQRVVAFVAEKGYEPCSIVDVPKEGALTRAQLVEFSVHWPLTFRKPSLEPLELSSGDYARYLQWLERALEVGQGRCGCVIVDKNGQEVSVAAENNSLHPLRHAVMAAIDKAAEAHLLVAETPQGIKRRRSLEDYLCQDCEVITTHEPCVMCAMALVHSRVRLVAYHTPDLLFGGLGGKISLHLCQSLNHQFRVLRWLPV